MGRIRLLALGVCLFYSAQGIAAETLRIGVLAYRGDGAAVSMWQPTAEFLSKVIPDAHFQVVPLDLEQLQQEVRDQRLHFILTNPASYIQLERDFGISRIATLRKRIYDEVVTQFGAVIFSRSDRLDINELNDLRGKRFMAVHPDAFGGWWMAWRELKEKGIDPEEDLDELQFSGFPQDLVVDAVLGGRVDAGTVRTGLLEQLARAGKLDMKQIRVLQPRYTPGILFAHSSRLYPEWPFAVARHTSKHIAQRVALALLNMPEDATAAAAAHSAGWTVPLDYQPVNLLMQDLRVGGYEHLDQITIGRLVQQYGLMLLAALLIVSLCMAVTLYVIKLNLRLKQSRKDLEVEMEERKRAEQIAKSQERRVHALYDVTSLSGVSYDEQIEVMLDVACELLEMEFGRITEVDRAQGTSKTLHIVAPEDFGIRQGQVLPLHRTFCSISVSLRSAMVVHNIGESQLRDHPAYRYSRLEAYIAAPIWEDGELFGTINFGRRTPLHSPFEETDLDLVKLMGRWVGMVLERKHAQVKVELARRQADEASHAKSRFLAKMSHELRTPLTAILGYCELLMEEAQEEQRTALLADLQRIHGSGRHLMALISDVLDLSKIEAGKVELYSDSVDIQELVDELADTIRPMVHTNGNTLEITVQRGIGTMQVDVTRLRQVLLNLLSNAAKFTRHGCIAFTASLLQDARGGCVAFSVSDTGIGISEEHMEHLFEEFSQADPYGTREIGGTGLGLAISRRLCRVMGGGIFVESEPGKGSTFRVELPVAGAGGKLPSDQTGADGAAHVV